MDTDKLLFEVTTKQGHKYKVYLNGKIEGFPEGSFLINHAFPLLNKTLATFSKKSGVLPYVLQSLEVREIVKHFLFQNGFDGLVDCYGECGCELDDLMRCNCSCIECLAAYQK